MEDIRIKVISDDSQLDGTAKKLSGLGHISDENARKFQEAGQKHGKALRETGDEMGRVETKIRNLGERLIAIFAVERIFEFASESVKAFEDAEKAANSLKFAVENINKGGKEGFESLIKQSETLASKLKNLYTPKQIQEAQQQLAMAKVQTSDIMKAMPLILDVAARSHKSVTEVTEAFIRGMQGTSRALKDFGISAVKGGDNVERFNVIMDKLKGFTGGATDALSEYSSQSQIAANNTEILQEKLGKKLAPAWEGVKTYILATTNSVLDFFSAINTNKADEAFRKMAALMGHGEFEIQHQVDLLKYRKLNNKEVAETLKAENEFLKIMSATDEGYDDQLKKVKLLTEVAKERIKEKPGEESPAVKFKKKEAENLSKLTEKELKRRLQELVEGNYEEDKLYEHFSEIDAEKEKTRIEKELKGREEYSKKKKDQLEKELKGREEYSKKKKDQLEKELKDGEKLWEDYLADIEKIRFDERQATLKADEENIKAGEKLWEDYLKDINDITDKSHQQVLKDDEQKRKERIDNIVSFVKSAMDQYNQLQEMEIANIDHKEELQKNAIDVQRGLAERGLKNDLAFEERKQAELEKQRMKDQRKMKRAKELETFLNSVAEFSKTAKNPGEAVTKAIAQLALVKGAEAMFAEEGGIVGQSREKSTIGLLGFSRRHSTGGDMLIHGQKGEGILSRKEMRNLGGEAMFFDLKKSLSMPMSERGIPIAAVISNSTTYGKEIVYKLDSIEQTLKGNTSTQIDFDKMHNMIVSVTKNGNKEITKYITPKSI